ncbi:glycosyltransferase family 4 protein [Cellulomonas sp. NS3]|uniref:glycosyltransferase family 4 protein n=1 Tax=Cellulomonas sp. NS3 TaxID=2973977 RepID=UPI002163B348|nr:glycosyltransferase family 1 protein [Cellulomonas sp. NS3]
MRVLVDATAIPADRGGVGRYVDNLLPAVAALGVDLAVVCQARDVASFAQALPGAEIVAAPAAVDRRPVRLAWEQTGLPLLARRLRADVLHCPHYTMPQVGSTPVVVTLHDATFFSHPELHGDVKRRFFQTWTKVAVRRAATLVVPSEATGREVRRFAGGDERAFHVAYHGVDTSVFHPVPPEERERVRATLGLDGWRYIAFLGTLEPRKNVPALVRAWVGAVRDLPEPPVLVLAGGPGWDTGVEPALAAVPAGLDARRAGYLPLDDLPGFLAGAEFVAYPSLGEGFGLPVLEAMACGAAVLTSRELSLPEVGGDAVAYTSLDDEGMSRAIGDLLADAETRARLATAATARAAGFTWDVSARRHVEAYEAAVATRG